MMSFYSSAGLCHDAGKGKALNPEAVRARRLTVLPGPGELGEALRGDGDAGPPAPGQAATKFG